MTLFPRTISRSTFTAIGMLVAVIGIMAALLAPMADVLMLRDALYAVACAALVIAVGYAGTLFVYPARIERE